MSRLSLLLLLFCLTSCSRKEVPGHGQHLLELIKEATGPNSNAGVTGELFLDSVERVKAEGFPQTPEFFVASGTPGIDRFPCGRCHDQPLSKLVQRSANEGKKAHWNITLQHAPASTMACKTCHGEDKMEELATLNGATVNMNHSYQVCGQCHSKQLKDWAGGAHGKRLGGWAPPRVVSNCAACHNPHRPALESRLPARKENTTVDEVIR